MTNTLTLTPSLVHPGIVTMVLQHFFTWWAIPVLVVIWYGYGYLVSHRHLRDIPAPLGAQISNLWLAMVTRLRGRSLYVDRAHGRLGKMVRIQPNHVSIADESAIAAIYGHGNGFLKADFYDVFVSVQPSVFNTRSRTAHARKRKLVSNAFSLRNVTEFEPYVRSALDIFINKLDTLINESPHRDDGGKPEARVDAFSWLNFLAFDIIGDLAFGAPFGMLQREADEVEARDGFDGPSKFVSAVDLLHQRGETNATLGCIPWFKPWVTSNMLPIPSLQKGIAANERFTGVAAARIKQRLNPSEPPLEKRRDILARLIESRDEDGKPLDVKELTAEATAYLVAGSDTTSTALCIVMESLSRHPQALKRLQTELDAVMPDDVIIPHASDVNDLPYLNWVINECLRHHTVLGLGLPRRIPDDSAGVTILGRYFPPGTVLSVPTYTLHHDGEIWGDDVREFKPERWATLTTRQKTAFNPFSHGPRACIGRSLAEMELRLITATWARRYAVRPLADMKSIVKEGFLRKPVRVDMALSRRS